MTPMNSTSAIVELCTLFRLTLPHLVLAEGWLPQGTQKYTTDSTYSTTLSLFFLHKDHNVVADETIRAAAGFAALTLILGPALLQHPLHV